MYIDSATSQMASCLMNEGGTASSGDVDDAAVDVRNLFSVVSNKSLRIG